MSELPRDRLFTLRAKIEQQRNTIEALKREGHDCPDAELQLQRMLVDLHRAEAPPRRADPASGTRRSPRVG